MRLAMTMAVLVVVACGGSSRPTAVSVEVPPPRAPALAPASLPARDAASDRRVRALIAMFASVDEQGLGYSGAYTGSEFLPYPGSGQAHVLLLQQPPPVASGALREVVELGAVAVPVLVECLADARPTRIPPVQAMMWTAHANEYDVNRRTEPAPPPTVNREGPEGMGGPEGHQLTVGDLCFVALGQIVNRGFNAARYQPSGGIVISSPPGSPELRRVIEDDFRGFTAERHLASLLRDFREPDHALRREGAALRLAFYYPHALEEAAVEVLRRPTYDVFAVERFARDVIYDERRPERRRDLFARFVEEHGAAGREGLELQLFRDLSLLEAQEEHRINPPLDLFATEPREILVAQYGRPAGVRSDAIPYADHLATTELAALVGVLVHDESRRIDEVVHSLMTGTGDAGLALACMRRLVGRGLDDDVRRVAAAFAGRGGDQAAAFREVLGQLDQAP